MIIHACQKSEDVSNITMQHITMQHKNYSLMDCIFRGSEVPSETNMCWTLSRKKHTNLVLLTVLRGVIGIGISQLWSPCSFLHFLPCSLLSSF